MTNLKVPNQKSKLWPIPHFTFLYNYINPMILTNILWVISRSILWWTASSPPTAPRPIPMSSANAIQATTTQLALRITFLGYAASAWTKSSLLLQRSPMSEIILGSWRRRGSGNGETEETETETDTATNFIEPRDEQKWLLAFYHFTIAHLVLRMLQKSPVLSIASLKNNNVTAPPLRSLIFLVVGFTFLTNVFDEWMHQILFHTYVTSETICSVKGQPISPAESVEQKECVICLGTREGDDDNKANNQEDLLVENFCEKKHCYAHRICILEYVSSSSTRPDKKQCPMCRGPLLYNPVTASSQLLRRPFSVTTFTRTIAKWVREYWSWEMVLKRASVTWACVFGILLTESHFWFKKRK